MAYNNSGLGPILFLLFLEYIFRRRMFSRCIRIVENEAEFQEQELKIMQEHIAKLSHEIQNLKKHPK